jgi:hypothetical protein
VFKNIGVIARVVFVFVEWFGHFDSKVERVVVCCLLLTNNQQDTHNHQNRKRVSFGVILSNEPKGHVRVLLRKTDGRLESHRVVYWQTEMPWLRARSRALPLVIALYGLESTNGMAWEKRTGTEYGVKPNQTKKRTKKPSRCSVADSPSSSFLHRNKKRLNE